MHARKALEISREAKETIRLSRIRKKTGHLTALRGHSQYAGGRAVANAIPALAAIHRSALSGSTAASYHVCREARPPTVVQAAQALGEAERIAEKLRELGYAVEVGFPSMTHDRDGDNGITVTSRIEWE